MINYILYTCLLALFQAWVLPAALNASNAKWMLGNRDQDPEGSITVSYTHLTLPTNREV